MFSAATTLATLALAEWEPVALAHAERVDAETAAHRRRASRGETHPVDDFVYSYYGTRPARLRRWHPGAGVGLEDAPERETWPWYVVADGVATVDITHFWGVRGATVDFVTGLIGATLRQPARLGCFGLHEWAMVYRDADTRHALPLRLGGDGTDAVVDANPLTCTHFDAYRFFTSDAAPRNERTLTRDGQATSEQPGCLHAAMDLYKWCVKLSPAISSSLTWDCFSLAVEVRRLDMAASPYDVSGFGIATVAIETAAGKAEYARRQQEFSVRSDALRRRILTECETIRTLVA